MTNIFTKIKELLFRPLPIPNTELSLPEDLETQEAIQGLMSKFELPMPNLTCPTHKPLPELSDSPVILRIPQRVYVEAMEKEQLKAELRGVQQEARRIQKRIDVIDSEQ